VLGGGHLLQLSPGPLQDTLKLAKGPPRPEQGLLHLVFGVVDRAEHPVAVRQQLNAERIGQAREFLA
jgi:hypothetical protein